MNQSHNMKAQGMTKMELKVQVIEGAICENEKNYVQYLNRSSKPELSISQVTCV